MMPARSPSSRQPKKTAARTRTSSGKLVGLGPTLLLLALFLFISAAQAFKGTATWTKTPAGRRSFSSTRRHQSPSDFYGRSFQRACFFSEGLARIVPRD